MTMSSSVSKVTLNGDGVQTSWPFSFKVWKAGDLEVSITNAEGATTVVSNWSVELAGVGGTVTYPTSGPMLPSGSKITIARSMDFLQDVDLVSGTRWDPEVVETALDQATAERQQLKERLDRAVTVPISGTQTSEALVSSIFEARDTAVDNAASALDSAERAEIAASTVAYYNHEGTLLEDEGTISLPWAYDTNVGVEVYLSGVKQPESSLIFTDAYTVTLDTPVEDDTPFEVVASAGAKGDLANILADEGGSNLVGFLQAGTGAIARTVQDKGRDVVSVKDFGAVGDGVTDDTAAIQAAVDAVYVAGGGAIFFPVGTYIVSASLQMKRGVSLVGDGPIPAIPQFYVTDPTAEGYIQGISTIKAADTLEGDIIVFDFSATTRLERPHGTEIINILINGQDQVSGHAVHFIEGPSEGCIFNNGNCSDAVLLHRVCINGAAGHGVYQETDVNTVKYYECKIANCGEWGMKINNCNDNRINDCQIFESKGGVWLNGSTTNRITNCDIFNINYDAAVSNSGVGLLDDSILLKCYNSYIQNTDKEAVKVIASAQTTTNKGSVYALNTITGGSGLANDTYDNMYVGSRNGVGIGGLILSNNIYSSLANTETANKARYGLYLDAAITTATRAIGCTFFSLDVATAGNNISPIAKQYIDLVSCTIGGQTYIDQSPAPLVTSVGGNWAPNILVGPRFFKTANTLATNMTGFSTGGLPVDTLLGKELWVLIDDEVTSVDFTSSNLTGNGGVDLAAGASTKGKLLHFKNFNGTKWAAVIYG